MRKITINLDPKSIDKAIKELQEYKRDLKSKINELVEELTYRGEEIAKIEVKAMDAVYTGELERSIKGYFSHSTGVGIIEAGAPYAVYVEFGTGVVGEGSPHPDIRASGWVYDINNHGEEGWVYFNERDGKLHWTKGFKSRPFMYNTAQQLEKECSRIAREVFSR